MATDLTDYARQTQYQATVQALGSDPTVEKILDLTDQALRFATLSLDHLAGRSPQALACGAGCHFCCYLMATVSAPEALAIAHRLRETLTEGGMAAIRQRVSGALEQTDTLNNLERVREAIPCPFLDASGLCDIYGFRPLDCATYHSLSREDCEEKLNQPQRAHPTYAAMQAIGMGIKSGLGHGLAEVGLERPALRYELIEALHICLEDRQAMSKYLAGKNPLKPAAIIIDEETGISYKIKHAPPHLRTLAKKVFAQERRAARNARRRPRHP